MGSPPKPARLTPWCNAVTRQVPPGSNRLTLSSPMLLAGSQRDSMLIIGKSLGHRSESATRVCAGLATDPACESAENATVAMIAAADGTTITKGGGRGGG